MNTITVLMSTYNGEKYLKEQIDSLLRQKEVELLIFVRDDGSTDSTKDILDSYKKQGILDWYDGKNIGPANSFMDLINNAPESEYYAFCDQDDVWLEDKLEIAINRLNQFQDDKPSLYYGNPRIVDSKLKPLKILNKKEVINDFNSSLIVSDATGCTMVFNKKLKNIVKSKKPEYILMHDGWIHKVCIITHGNLYYDRDVHILYRQHENNVIGASHESLFKRIKLFFKKLREQKCAKSKVVKALYDCYYDYCTEYEKRLLELIIGYKKNTINKLKLLFNNNIKTKYPNRNLKYKLFVLFGIF